MNDPKVVRDPLYYQSTERQALAARPQALTDAERSHDTLLYDNRAIWLCLAGAATLACLVGSGFGLARDSAGGAPAGAAATLASLLASPAAHGARTVATRDTLYRFTLPPALLAVAIMLIQVVPTYQSPAIGLAVCLVLAGGYLLFAPHYTSSVVWPTMLALPLSPLIVSTIDWRGVGDLPPFIGLAVAAGGLVVGLVVVAVGRRLFAVPARGALLPWLAVSPGFVMLAASGLAMPPDWLAVATSGVLVAAAAWWMRATSVVQATWRCIPLIMLLNFWGGIAGQAGVPWLGPLSALAVVAEFTLIVAAMVLIAASEARLVPTATFYFGPLVPVPRPDRAFDHPFDSYARDA